MRGIFYNCPKAQCSIYESGVMCFNALKQSNKYTLDYTEGQAIDNSYDFAIFNHHVSVNNWMTNGCLYEFKGKKHCIVLEVGHDGDLMPLTPRIFDTYLVIDPTVEDKNSIYSFPRPIERVETDEYIDYGYPIIGTFGFATDGKKWAEVVELANKDFDKAVVRINIPFATHVPDYRNRVWRILDEIKSIPIKSNISVEMTCNYMDKSELIRWCSRNTINYFPYYRNMAGLAAVTDQAISAKRPILVTNNPTFRHLLKYIKPYPEISLKEAIKENHNGVIQMYDNWSAENFYKKFEEIAI